MPKAVPKGKIEKYFYRRKEAAFALALSIRTIDTMISEQIITTRPYKRCVLIPACDVKRVADMILADKLHKAASTRK